VRVVESDVLTARLNEYASAHLEFSVAALSMAAGFADQSRLSRAHAA
jgi:hypothetical protein